MSLATTVLVLLPAIQTGKRAPHFCAFDFLPSRSRLYPSLPFSVPQEANLCGYINRLATSNCWSGLDNERHWLETRGWEGKEAIGFFSPLSARLDGGLTVVPFLYQRPRFLSGSHFLRLQDFPGSRSVCSSTLPSFGVLEHPLLGSLTLFFFNIYLFIFGCIRSSLLRVGFL